jgi:shikimate dehydrogenase
MMAHGPNAGAMEQRRMKAPTGLLLGLIGDNIAASRAPLLHRLAGEQNNITVRYDRLVPRELGQDFDAVFDGCVAAGYRGINITYPYKERVAARVSITDPLVRAIGALNTVVFDEGTPRGFNTDHTGFIAAYRAARSEQQPGAVCLIGAGGAGRAIAFALVALGASEIRVVDNNPAKAHALARDLASVAGSSRIRPEADHDAAAADAEGIVNCTPVGMVGHDGTPLEADAMPGAKWAFDAVYTPENTQFLSDARAAGLAVISGWELFFWQGVHAWDHFTGLQLDEQRLREDLRAEA